MDGNSPHKKVIDTKPGGKRRLLGCMDEVLDMVLSPASELLKSLQLSKRTSVEWFPKLANISPRSKKRNFLAEFKKIN